MAEATLTYDPDQNILSVVFPDPLDVETREQVVAHFQRVIDFWRARAGGRKSYLLVGLSNVTLNARCLETYTREIARVNAECAIASVRFGGTPLLRGLTRLTGIRYHRASNLYDTYEEALAAVRTMIAGNAPTK
jgi:hypothetical protein